MLQSTENAILSVCYSLHLYNLKVTNYQLIIKSKVNFCKYPTLRQAHSRGGRLHQVPNSCSNCSLHIHHVGIELQRATLS